MCLLLATLQQPCRHLGHKMQVGMQLLPVAMPFLCLSGDACKTCRDQNRKGVLPQGLRPRLGVVYMQPMHVAALQHKGRLVTSMQQ